MLYLDGTDVQTCECCGRRWVEVCGIQEPIEDDEFRDEEEDDGCLLCGGEW